MIELKNVSFSYGEKPVVANLGFSVQNGECVCLTGASGCGKTTVLRLVLGLIKPTSGTVACDGVPSAVFQEDRLVNLLNVRQNVLLPISRDRVQYTLDLLSEAGLGSSAGLSVHELSGGMKRRAAIVRAVGFGGDALILDEPFNGIDPATKRIVAGIIKREYLLEGKPVLMATHVPEDMDLLSARVVALP